MNLAIDIGNTSINAGLFDKYKLIKKSNFISIDKLIEFIESIHQYNISCAIISSVVPKLTIEYKKLLESIYHYIVIIIDYKLSKLSCNVNQPATIGADRLCNIFAAKQDYTFPAIIIDFGTATTYDIINKQGEFIGGAIGAGIETSAKYLIDKAALLDKTDLIFPKLAIGTNTTTNIQSGIMFGAIDQIEGMIKRMEEETETNYLIILTGGFAKLISSKLKLDHIVDSNLTLKGIIYIHESNN